MAEVDSEGATMVTVERKRLFEGAVPLASVWERPAGIMSRVGYVTGTGTAYGTHEESYLSCGLHPDGQLLSQ